MMKLSDKPGRGLVMCALAVASSSCVNMDYDFRKDIDFTVAFLKDVTLPVGDVQKIYVKDILPVDEGGMISTDAGGNYMITFAGGRAETVISVPEFVCDGFTYSVNVSPDFIVTLPGVNISGTGDIGTVRFVCSIETSSLPYELTGLKRCDVTSDITVSLRSSSPSSGQIVLEPGAEIIFPDFLVLGPSLPEGLARTGSCTFVTTHDFPVFPSAGFSFQLEAIDLEKVPSGQGITAPGHFNVTAEVLLSGNIRAENVPAESLQEMSGQLTLGQVRFSSAVAQVSTETVMDFSPVEVGAVPDFLAAEGTLLDLQGLRLDVAAESTFPIGGTLSAGISTYADGALLASVTIGPVGIATPDTGSASVSAFSFSQNGTGAPYGYADVRTDNFDDLLRAVPETVMVHDMKVVSGDDFAEICFGTDYYAGIDYLFSSPLSFGQEVNLSFTRDITGLGVDLSELGISEAEIMLDVVNSIPLDISLDVEAISADGSALPGIEVLVNSGIRAGIPDAPAVSPLVFSLSSSEGAIAFDGLRLVMVAASASEAYTGVPLNVGQGIELTNLTFRIPAGIIVDLGNTEEQ